MRIWLNEIELCHCLVFSVEYMYIYNNTTPVLHHE